jgi:hepatocyte growth factor-regulated tyrosine kinase substrate
MSTNTNDLDALLDLHSKLATVVRYYDRMLEERLSKTYQTYPQYGLQSSYQRPGAYPTLPVGAATGPSNSQVESYYTSTPSAAETYAPPPSAFPGYPQGQAPQQSPYVQHQALPHRFSQANEAIGSPQPNYAAQSFYQPGPTAPQTQSPVQLQPSAPYQTEPVPPQFQRTQSISTQSTGYVPNYPPQQQQPSSPIQQHHVPLQQPQQVMQTPQAGNIPPQMQPQMLPQQMQPQVQPQVQAQMLPQMQPQLQQQNPAPLKHQLPPQQTQPPAQVPQWPTNQNFVSGGYGQESFPTVPQHQPKVEEALIEL